MWGTHLEQVDQDVHSPYMHGAAHASELHSAVSIRGFGQVPDRSHTHESVQQYRPKLVRKQYVFVFEQRGENDWPEWHHERWVEHSR